MSLSRSALLALALAAAGCVRAPSTATSATAPAPAATSANPFFTESMLPFHAPPFDRIRDTDYKPALVEGMRQQLVEIEAIAAQTSEPTFENTIVAMERSGALLTRASKVFSAVVGANKNDMLQEVETELSPRFAEHSDAIYLNTPLYQRVKAIHDRRAAIGLTGEQKTLVERYYRDFVRAGAQLSDADKTKLRALNQELSSLSTAFSNKLLAATKAAAIVVDDRAQLDGLSDGRSEEHTSELQSR